jgi:hypothetical protein
MISRFRFRIIGNCTHSHGPGAHDSHQPHSHRQNYPVFRKCVFSPLVRTTHYYYSESFDTCDGEELKRKHHGDICLFPMTRLDVMGK